MKSTRRAFLQTAAAAAAGPLIVPASTLGQNPNAPSKRITVGIVGVGSRGFALIGDFIKETDAQIVAVCDVDSLHYRDKPWGEGTAFGLEPAKASIERYYSAKNPDAESPKIDTYGDYRELCARDDIDAVVVATPDHWHALCTLEALRNGKDVYCEKPLTHFFHEGQLVYREVVKSNAVFQAGSQQRSDPRFRRAVELVLNGHIGHVQRVEVGLPPGYAEPMGDMTIEDPPEHIDYEFWCGPGEVLPYMRARHHRWWRGHTAYGGGVLMDFIGHHNDIAHWGLGMDASGPTRVEAVGWVYPETDIYNTPHKYAIHCEYEGGISIVISSEYRDGTKWIGEDGWVFVTRGKIEASDPRWLENDFDPGPVKAYASPGHARNFLDCIKSREPCIAPAETAHRSVTPGHLAYVSHAVGRPLAWDPAAERVTNDDEAQALLASISYRNPWALEA